MCLLIVSLSHHRMKFKIAGHKAQFILLAKLENIRASVGYIIISASEN